jgi:hypothetical protein
MGHVGDRGVVFSFVLTAATWGRRSSAKTRSEEPVLAEDLADALDSHSTHKRANALMLLIWAIRVA